MMLINKAGNAVIWINRRLWNMMPDSFCRSRIGVFWGTLIFRLVGLRKRNQLTTTYFFRNRPELKLMEEICCGMADSSPFRVAVIGCSEGAEVYSIIYSLKRACPDIRLEVQGFDICREALDVARDGRYLTTSKLLSMTLPDEIDGLFERKGDQLEVRPEIKSRVAWQLADPTRQPTINQLLNQDVVVANRFLFHMAKEEQFAKLHSIATHVRPGGYLFVTGVDLGVRTRLAREMGWQPITKSLEEIHNADKTMTVDWPLKYWGLEPFNKRHPDWQLRYCQVFRMPHSK